MESNTFEIIINTENDSFFNSPVSEIYSILDTSVLPNIRSSIDSFGKNLRDSNGSTVGYVRYYYKPEPIVYGQNLLQELKRLTNWTEDDSEEFDSFMAGVRNGELWNGMAYGLTYTDDLCALFDRFEEEIFDTVSDLCDGVGLSAFAYCDDLARRNSRNLGSFSHYKEVLLIITISHLSVTTL